MTAAAEIGRLRAVAQRLVGAQGANAAEAVRWLTAVQAQDLRGAVTSVALRTASRSRADVLAALDRGEVVRAWPMRGTLHLVCSEDLLWLLELLAPRQLKASAARRAGLGLDEAQLDRGRELAVAALSGGVALERRALFGIWESAGLATGGQRGIHLLQYLALTGTVVLGPTREAHQLVVLTSDWITRPRRLERTAALGELAWRYFRSHGPASLRDLARWARLTVTDARAGLALVRDRLEVLDVDGVELFMDPETPARLASCRTQAHGVVLLPRFDEMLLGYGDRAAVLDPAFAQRIAPGGNGMFRATVLSAGRVVATWRHAGSGRRRRIEVEPFAAIPPAVADGIERAYASLP